MVCVHCYFVCRVGSTSRDLVDDFLSAAFFAFFCFEGLFCSRFGREKTLVADSTLNRRFSLRLLGDLYLNRAYTAFSLPLAFLIIPPIGPISGSASHSGTVFNIMKNGGGGGGGGGGKSPRV